MDDYAARKAARRAALEAIATEWAKPRKEVRLAVTGWWRQALLFLASLPLIRRLRLAMRARIKAVPICYGKHFNRAEGMCATEVVAWIAGEEHTDEPKCACPVISHAVRCLNDRIVGADGYDNTEDADRVRAEIIAPLLPKLVGSRSTKHAEEKRAVTAASIAGTNPQIKAYLKQAWDGQHVPVEELDAASTAGKAVAALTPESDEYRFDPATRKRYPRKQNIEGYKKAAALIERMLEIRGGGLEIR